MCCSSKHSNMSPAPAAANTRRPSPAAAPTAAAAKIAAAEVTPRQHRALPESLSENQTATDEPDPSYRAGQRIRRRAF
jgi:hypothetical protein